MSQNSYKLLNMLKSAAENFWTFHKFKKLLELPKKSYKCLKTSELFDNSQVLKTLKTPDIFLKTPENS
jgi:hypothetical protein